MHDDSRSPQTSEKTTDAAMEHASESVTLPEPSPIGDMNACVQTLMNAKLSEVCDGQCIRNNDGTHLDGDMPEDKMWQPRHKKMASPFFHGRSW